MIITHNQVGDDSIIIPTQPRDEQNNIRTQTIQALKIKQQAKNQPHKKTPFIYSN